MRSVPTWIQSIATSSISISRSCARYASEALLGEKPVSLTVRMQVSLSNLNVYACLVCGKYFQGLVCTHPERTGIASEYNVCTDAGYSRSCIWVSRLHPLRPRRCTSHRFFTNHDLTPFVAQDITCSSSCRQNKSSVCQMATRLIASWQSRTGDLVVGGSEVKV